MPLRAILFDKDGTLIDFQRTWGPATVAILRHFANGDAGAFERLVAVSGLLVAEQRFRPDSPLVAGATKDYGPLWADVLGRAADDAFFAEIDHQFAVRGLEHLTPIGDPKAVLSRLAQRGYRLGICTNDADEGARKQAQRLGIAGLVEFIAGYDSGFGAKPEAGPVLAFARAVGVAPQEIVVVGDSAHDLIAARAAGSVALAVLSGPAAPAELAPHADAVIDSIDGLPAWLVGR
jgi:phosphoglycolate phosphatase